MVRIFLVDDNAMMRSQLRTILEKTENWKVVGEAADGRGAIEHWEESEPNFTVMDFVMPEMDGLEASRNLSAQHPEIPILMVTIDPSRQLEEEAKKVGIRGLVQKADVKGMLKAVEELVSGGTYFRRDFAAA